MSSEQRIEFKKDNIDLYLKEVAKAYRKLVGKAFPAEIVLIGGASILVKAYEVLGPMKHIIPITYTISCLCQPLLIPFEKSFQWDALLRKQWNG